MDVLKHPLSIDNIHNVGLLYRQSGCESHSFYIVDPLSSVIVAITFYFQKLILVLYLYTDIYGGYYEKD
jgi:uncharacterized membrane protein